MDAARGGPEGLGHAPGAPLPPVGRAARWSAVLADGAAGEIWRLPADAGRVAGRLVDLGARGVGGFAMAGSDGEGVWLARRAPSRSLAEWLAARPGPVDGAAAAVMVAALAGAAAACEEAALFPGPLDPDGLVVRDGAIEIAGAGLVAALVGGAPADSRAIAPASARWLAPEQADGQRADAASNRYVIGLVLYRLLAGEHAFAGRGLRRGLEDQRQRGAPPLPESVAASLPPGLHGYCLRMLDPDPGRRPPRAGEIAEHLRRLAGAGAAGDRAAGARPGTGAQAATGRRAAAAMASETAPNAAAADAVARRAGPGAAAAMTDSAGAASSEAGSGATSAGFPASTAGAAPALAALRARRLRWVATAAPVVVAALAAIALVRGAGEVTAAGEVRAGTTGPRPAIGSARELADCASCHPRQAAEWSRSVMAHAARSPLFESLEILIEEQVGRDRDCPGGAGVLRAAGPGACRSRATGIPITGSGGALWCVNCHVPGENLAASLPAWDGRSAGSPTRRPLVDLMPAAALEGIGCAACHQAIGPSHPGNQGAGLYEGNPSWTSPDTGNRFLMRPEDGRGLPGIANSGYFLDPLALSGRPGGARVPGGGHAAASPSARRYLASSEFCGACHDVRLFGTDALTGARRGEHFKRLRNAYSEWVAWSEEELRAGRVPATCQDCHMSLFPGVCAPGADTGGSAARPRADAGACPPGTSFQPRPPGSYARGRAAAGAPIARVTSHYFSGVDVPLSPIFDAAAIDDPTVDVGGVPIGARQRRDLLLARAFRLALEPPRLAGGTLEVPVVIENVGAGHRVPAGFSQEREFWIHLVVKDARGRVVYEVGRVDRGDQDLRDKIFLRVETDARRIDGLGRPIGLFGADVADGPDLPRWSPSPNLGGTRFRGRGLINLQNGFLRCVRCIGRVDAGGRCQAGPGQEGRRAARYADGDYDPDTGECRSNLNGLDAFFETFFPVGALDAERGLVKGPDAIIDTRSAPPGQALRYAYDLEVAPGSGPFTVEARLLFRAFPPFLVRAFIDHEAAQDRRGLRPSGPLVGPTALERLEVVEIASARAVAE